MKKTFSFIVTALCVTMLTGCGMPMFNALNDSGTRTTVELSGKNFKVVKHVEGFSSATYILGIGGMSKAAVRDNAVSKMVKQANLIGSQTIANVYVKSHVTSFLGIYVKVSYAATGDIIEFLDN